MSTAVPPMPAEPWCIRMRACGSANRLPFVPAESRNWPALAAMPTAIVETSFGIDRMTSAMASIAETEPPGELIQKRISRRGSSAARVTSCAQSRLPPCWSSSSPSTMMRSWWSRRVSSTSIGWIGGVSLSLMRPACAGRRRHGADAAQGSTADSGTSAGAGDRRALAELARGRGEALLGVEPGEHGARDRVELAELLGGEHVEHVRAHGVDVTGRGPGDEVHARLGDGGVGRTAVGGAREAVDEPALLEAAGDVREAGEGRVRLCCERRHPHGSVGCAGEGHEGAVLEVGEAGVVEELRVEGGRK